jgi:hypothetical protein
MLDEFNYSYWKSCMPSHLRFVCVELWGVVENGFPPVDEKYMTPKERIDCQLNSTALDKIHQSLKCEVYDQVSSIESTKELWEKLSVKFDGTSAMQKTKYEAVKQDMNLFCMNDGERSLVPTQDSKPSRKRSSSLEETSLMMAST